jgi:FkbM family methyltransferase
MINFLKLYQKFDDIISYLFSNTVNEKKFLKSYFKNKKIIVIDIGSNYGNFIDLVINNLNIKKIYAFEPSTVCFNYLKENYSMNNIKIINIALSNLKKRKKFFESEILSQSSLYNRKNKFIGKIKNKSIYYVQTNTLDSFYKKNKSDEIYDLVKIDAEGEDFKIINGMKFLLKNFKVKLLKIEIENYKKNSLKNIILFMGKFNYKLISISKTKYSSNRLYLLDVYFSPEKTKMILLPF